MQDTPKKPEQQSPAEIAREAFRRLAARRIAPTPEAYRKVYEEVAGIHEQTSAEQVLSDFAARLKKAPGEIGLFGNRFQQAADGQDWKKYRGHLNQLVEAHLLRPPGAPLTGTLSDSLPAAVTATPLSASQTEVLPALKESISLVDEPIDSPGRASAIALVDPLPVAASADAGAIQLLVDGPPVPASGPKHTMLMREMLVRTWTLAVCSLLHGAPELAKESEALAEEIRLARSEKTLIELSARLRQLCFRIEQKSGELAEEHELLLRLFKLLFDNVGELLEDDTWLSGQIARIQTLLNGPVNHVTLLDATRSLKDVIYKQGLLKHSLKEAKATLKNMMLTFIDRIGKVATTTGDFHERIGGYTQQIGKAKDIVDLNRILDQVMQDTRAVQTEALRSRDNMMAAKESVQAAEARVNELESQLQQMSELAREDQLTGSLNRRGLDEVLEREMARAKRKKSPLCVALLDLDNFKRLNDTHGHSAGDQALIHLVNVVKDTLRSMDVIARYGGEEFLIVLPDTPAEDAVQTVTRVQRELTKRIFMHNNQRLLITFSSGVALYNGVEDQEALVSRADEALYKAKKAGKNRVVSAG